MKDIFSKRPLLILAPMAGITDLPFRVICKELGADIIYSEMVSAAGLAYSKAKTLQYVKSNKHDQPLVIQLFGNKSDNFAKATKIIDSLPACANESSKPRKPEGLDINFGCPVKKVLKQGAGCELMKNPVLAYEIIKTVTDNTSLPVSIKIRAGVSKTDALEFLKQVADLPWKAVIVHGRTFKQGFSGPIDYELIKDIKLKYPDKTIIANGGIFSPEIARDILDKTKADGIAIARGALGKPWIFSQIKSFLKTGAYHNPDMEEIKKTALRHAELAAALDENYNFLEFRKHLGWYFKGIPGAKELRNKLFKINTLEHVRDVMNTI